MKKCELMKLRKLKATGAMMRLAEEDIPRKMTFRYWGGVYTKESCRYDLYMRCIVQNGILILALYQPQSMRLGSRQPAFQTFFDRKERKFLTYDYERKRWLTGKLDRIDWRANYWEKATRWISSKDAETAMDYLGTDTGDYWGILKYQQGIRADELKIRHRRETDPWDADLEQTPAKPKDWERWVGKVAIPEHFIFYDYLKKGATIGYCSYCEKEVPIRKPRHNKTGKCPCCRHEITFKAKGKAGTFDTKTYSAYLMQRCKDGMVIRWFTVNRRYRKGEYTNPEQTAFERRRTICSATGELWRAYYWGDYRHTELRWIKGGVMSSTSCQYYYHDYTGRVYGKTLPDLMRRGLSRTGLREYLNAEKKIDPERYLTALKRLPQLELVAKAKLPRLANDCMKRSYDFEEKLAMRDATSLTKLLGISTYELKRLRQCNGGIDFLSWLQYEKTTGKEIPDKVISWFCAVRVSPSEVDFISDRMTMLQIYNYIRRNMEKEQMSCREVLTTWADYLSMATRFHMDTTDEVVYRTNKLRLRHDELVAKGISKDIAIQAGKILQKFPHVEEICKELGPKYEYSGDEYVILAPGSIEEIIQEGNLLHHCIASSERYWERIENHESYLLFLRRAAEPQQAYYTMEVEPGGTVRQIRTYHDRQNKDIDAARGFLRKWQAVVSKRLTEDDHKKAETSRVLRIQEFVQMRNDQVVIHTGHLAGHLLADVLAADLMENIAA